MNKSTAKFLLIFGLFVIAVLLITGIIQSIILNNKQQQAGNYSNQIEQIEDNNQIPQPQD